MTHYESITHMSEVAVREGMINESDAERLRFVISSHKGWASCLMDTGLTPDGQDLYSICADYL